MKPNRDATKLLNSYTWPTSVRAIMEVKDATLYILRHRQHVDVKVFVTSRSVLHTSTGGQPSHLLLLAFALTGGWNHLHLISCEKNILQFRLAGLDDYSLACTLEQKIIMSIVLLHNGTATLELRQSKYFEKSGTFRFAEEFVDKNGSKFYFKRLEINRRIAPAEMQLDESPKITNPYLTIDATV